MRSQGGAWRPEQDRGDHTLRVLEGTIVGRNGDDVFVELGRRMQGVLSARSFPLEPREGDVHEFTLRGLEDGLWALSLRDEASLPSWETMEVGSLVHARMVRLNPGGLEARVGSLHAFLPRSHAGLPRGKSPAGLVGRTLACEVIEVDRERQRVTLSRKEVQRREQGSGHQRKVSALEPGQVVQGRVTRLEPYGAFLRFGRGLSGLIHVSDLSHDRVDHPADVLRLGEVVEAKVLHIRRQGKRIALGIKQLASDPWEVFEREHAPGDVLTARATRVVDYGVFVQVRPGVQGLVHRSEMPLGPNQDPRRLVAVGDELTVRVRSIEPRLTRLSLSLLARDGRALGAEDTEPGDGDGETGGSPEADAPGVTLGAVLRRALSDEYGDGGAGDGVRP